MILYPVFTGFFWLIPALGTTDSTWFQYHGVVPLQQSNGLFGAFHGKHKSLCCGCSRERCPWGEEEELGRVCYCTVWCVEGRGRRAGEALFWSVAVRRLPTGRRRLFLCWSSEVVWALLLIMLAFRFCEYNFLYCIPFYSLDCFSKRIWFLWEKDVSYFHFSDSKQFCWWLSTS